MKRKNYHFLASCLCGIFAVINITAVPITKAATLPDYSANMYAQTSVVGNNLLEDGDFENATSSWYASTSDNAALLVCTDSDIDHIPSKENCIKITGRTANWNSIVQEISSKVKNNTDYQFSFWVRLSAEYGDETREVQLCTTKKDSKDPSEVYDTLTMTGGKAIVSSKEWTKIEGTLHVSYSDTLEKLEFKIAEQGAPLSNGTYGSFYLDNAELYELESQALEIETDIKDLKQQFQEDFGGKAGVAIPDTALENTVRMELVTKHYNSITAENEMKPDAILGLTPSFNDDGSLKLDFSRADKLMDYIKTYNTQHQDSPIYVRGHVLIWHSQTPEWFFHEDYDDAKPYVSKDEMLKRIEYYIKEVTTHFETTYPDMIYAWDVVNEAVDDETGETRTNSSWYKVFGDNSFVSQAFVYANQYAGSNTKLFYNDYNETVPLKREGICRLLKQIKDTPNARIDGMGMQAHYNMESPTISQFEEAARSYSAIVDEIQLTELDLKSSSDYDGTNQSMEYTKQAYRYKAIFDKIKILGKEGINITSVTLWGTDDGNSWLQNSSSVGGGTDGNRPQCPLLFDDNYKAKPAYWGIVNPSKLEPFTQTLTSIYSSKDTWDSSDTTTFSDENTEIEFKTLWNETGLSILVSVSDSTNDADDSITVYIDETNSKKDGALIKTFSLKREDCTITEQGYQGIITIPLENTFAAKKIGFDLQITNHTQKVSWNDLKHTQNTSSKYYGELILKPFSSILYGTISVDGTLEELWDKAESIPLTIKTNQTDVKANVKAMWDENYLYFYANVIDSCLNKVSADAYQQDSIEIFIDENNHKSDSYENDDSQYRINFENEVSFNGVNCKQENLISKAVLTDDGYFIEAAFKWIEITPREGDKIGLEFQVNDADNSGSRIGTISWFDETGMGWSSPSVFGTVNLVKETSSDDITTTPEPNNPSDDTTTTPEPNNSSNNSSSAISTTPQTQEKEEENQQKENQEEKKENQQENQIGTIIKDVDNKTAYYIIDNKTSEFTGLLSKNKKNVIIPSTVDFNGVSYKITSVAKNALKGNKKVASLTVGSNIKTIGDQAFSDCTTLKNITIGKNTSSIGKKAFYNCKKVNTIIIKTNKLNKNSIGKNAFTKINKNAVIKVPKKKLASYTKLLHKAGVPESVKIISI